MTKITKNQALIMCIESPEYLDEYKDFCNSLSQNEIACSLAEFIQQIIQDEKYIGQYVLGDEL